LGRRAAEIIVCGDAKNVLWKGRKRSRGKREEGGIETLHVSITRELKSSPSTSPTHPGRMMVAKNLIGSRADYLGSKLESMWHSGGAVREDVGGLSGSTEIQSRSASETNQDKTISSSGIEAF